VAERKAGEHGRRLPVEETEIFMSSVKSLSRREILKLAGSACVVAAAGSMLRRGRHPDIRERQWRDLEAAIPLAAEVERARVGWGAEAPNLIQPHLLAGALMATHDDRAIPLLWRLRDFAGSWLPDSFAGLGTEAGSRAFAEVLEWATANRGNNDDAACTAEWGKAIVAGERQPLYDISRVLTRAQAKAKAAEFAEGLGIEGQWREPWWYDPILHEEIVSQISDTFFLGKQLSILCAMGYRRNEGVGLRLWRHGPALGVRCLAAGYLLGAESEVVLTRTRIADSSPLATSRI
jgi:hypothetical protein